MKPFSFLISPDSYLLQEHTSLLYKAEQSDTALYTFWGDDGLSKSFWEHLTLQGLFATPKLLIFRNAHLIQAAPFKELSQALTRLPSSVSIILCLEVAYERGKPKIPAHITKIPCYTYAQKKGWIKELPPLSQAMLPKFIQAEALKKEIQLSPSLIARLAKILPLDAATIASEIEKLSLTVDASGIVPDSALSLVEPSEEATIFDLLRFIQSGNNAPVAWGMVIDDRGEGLIFSFLAILTREARILWQLFMNEQPMLPPSMVASKRALAQSLGLKGIAKLWELVLDAEKGIKSGEKSPEQTFELLTAELFILFRRQAHGRG